jgi:predicted transcriptional regulator
MTTKTARQNVTISISPDIVRKARILAAKRSTSISALLAEQIEALIDEEEAWDRSQRSALAMLKDGFHLGGRAPVSRDELHER